VRWSIVFDGRSGTLETTAQRSRFYMNMNIKIVNLKDLGSAPWDSMGNDLVNSAQNRPYLKCMTALLQEQKTNADFREALRRERIDSPFSLIGNDKLLNHLASQSASFADALGAVDQLADKDRYTHRVRSALAWGLSDLDTASISLDLRTMSPEDVAQFKEEITFRRVQLQLIDEFLTKRVAKRSTVGAGS
jgi:hypothetical protein